MLSARPAGVQENVPLAPKTSMAVGGAARFFVEVQTQQALGEALAWAQSNDLPTAVLGGGSNLLCADSGFDGLVVRFVEDSLHISGQPSHVLLRVGAGRNWDDLVSLAVRRGWAGLECLSGIPGNVGAVPIQNVGAYGREVSEVIVSVEAVQRNNHDVQVFAQHDCEFGYRTSRFKAADRDRFVITAVTFRLTKGPAAALRYPELARRLENKPLTPQTIRSEVLSARREKSMVLVDGDPNARSCGSFFLNPMLSELELARLRRNLSNKDVPVYPAADEKLKVPAAWLIEQAGFSKGYRMGRAGVSEKHALALIAHDGATCADVLTLADTIYNGVLQRFGVHLEREPVLLGSAQDYQ